MTRDLPHLLRTGGIAALALALSVAAAVPSHADEFTDRDRITTAIQNQNADIDESNARLDAAVKAATDAHASLDAARSALAQASDARQAAQQRDAEMGTRLAAAEAALAQAKADVAQGQADVDAERTKIGQIARNAYQQSGPLVSYAVLASSQTTAELASRLQWNNEMMARHDAAMKEFQATLNRLHDAEAKQAGAQRDAEAAKADAARAVADLRAAELRQADQTNRVQAATEAADTTQAQAQTTLEEERNRLAALQNEAASVQQRIQDRMAREEAARQAAIAAEKARQEAIAAEQARQAAIAAEQARQAAIAAEQARQAAIAAEQARQEAAAAEQARQQAAAAEQARQQAAADAAARAAAAAKAEAAAMAQQQAQAAQQQAQAAQQQAQQSQQQAQQSQQQAQAPQNAVTETAGLGLAWPAQGAVTSGFGMRLHPVLQIWVLHDGTDFGAACGTPIVAVADGTVVERYWDTTGFGNRLIVDNGYINGLAVSSGYNHAEGWIVSVGQRVSKGQVLGYVGTTGLSTGCHLHLNLWINAKITDPMNYF